MSLMSKHTRIWRQGETTNPFVNQQISFSKSKRFKLFSIYWPQKSQSTGFIKAPKSKIDEQAHKISKLIDQQQKNQSRMNKTTLSLKNKMERNKSTTSKSKNTAQTFRVTRSISLSKQNRITIQRLTQTPQLKQAKLRDRHGFRTNLLQNQQDDFFERIKDKSKFRGTQTGFYTSRRVNLNLPHNYYPGPGTYEIKRFLQIQRKNSNKSQGC